MKKLYCQNRILKGYTEGNRVAFSSLPYTTTHYEVEEVEVNPNQIIEKILGLDPDYVNHYVVQMFSGNKEVLPIQQVLEQFSPTIYYWKEVI